MIQEPQVCIEDVKFLGKEPKLANAEFVDLADWAEGSPEQAQEITAFFERAQNIIQ